MLLSLPTPLSSTDPVNHAVTPNMAMSAICCMLPACPRHCHLRFCHLCLCSLTVIQQLNQTKHLICVQSPFKLILEPPAICNKHQLKLWPDLSVHALWWHRLPLGFIKAFQFGPAIFWCRFYLWRVCVPGNTDAVERTLRGRERERERGQRGNERQLFAQSSSRPHSWQYAVRKAAHSLNPASC